MTYIVSSRTLLGACAVAAVIAYAPAGFAHGAGGMGGMAGPSHMMAVQPPVTASPHPFDPSGPMPSPGTIRTPGPVTQAPVDETSHPTVGGRHLFTPDNEPVAGPPRTSSQGPTKVGAKPGTGTQVVNSPVEPR